MKHSALLTICFLLLNQGFLQATDSRKPISIENLSHDSRYKIDLKSKGGHKGFCMNIRIKNSGKDTCFAMVEAGRRLVSSIEKQQDIFVVKNTFAAIPPGATGEMDAYGFCCESHDASPAKESEYSVGKLEGKDWQRLASVVNTGDFEESAIQAAVWAISNNHAVSSIVRGKNDRNYELLKTVASIKNIEIPWYDLQYKTIPGQVFSNKPEMIHGEINYTVANSGLVSALVRNRFGIIMNMIYTDAASNKGENTFYLDIDISSWPEGTYSVEILNDGALISKREFNISTVQR